MIYDHPFQLNGENRFLTQCTTSLVLKPKPRCDCWSSDLSGTVWERTAICGAKNVCSVKKIKVTRHNKASFGVFSGAERFSHVYLDSVELRPGETVFYWHTLVVLRDGQKQHPFPSSQSRGLQRLSSIVGCLAFQRYLEQIEVPILNFILLSACQNGLMLKEIELQHIILIQTVLWKHFTECWRRRSSGWPSSMDQCYYPPVSFHPFSGSRWYSSFSYATRLWK